MKGEEYKKWWELARQKTGTPFYFYDISALRDRASDLKNYFPTCEVFFSAKSQNNTKILREVRGLGFGVDAVSAGEVRKAIKAEVPPEKIAMAGAGKTIVELEYAFTKGIGFLIVESIGELRRIKKILSSHPDTPTEILLRLNIGVETPATPSNTSTGHARSKFGISPDEVISCLEAEFGDFDQKIVGLHFHLGSPVFDVEAYDKAINKAAEVALVLRDRFQNINILDIGGGFAPRSYFAQSDDQYIDYMTRLGGVVASAFDRGFRKVFIEPGRFISSDCGFLVCEIQYIKSAQELKYVIVDAGMNDLLRPALYAARHEIVHPYNRDVSEKFAVAGPVCESSDVFGEGFILSSPTEGDLLAFSSVGAYGSSMASRYNARPLCAEFMLKDETLFLIREIEAIDELFRYERSSEIGDS